MNFEGLQGNRERRPNLEDTRAILLEKLQGMANKLNGECKDKRLNGNLVDQKGRIKPISFSNINGRENVDADLKSIKSRELSWIEVEKASQEKYYKKEPSIDKSKTVDEKKVLECWENENERKRSGQIEMLVTLLLHENLGSQFFVVRSSKHDDYDNAVDNLIINRKTGEVVCAFDEVVTSEGSYRPEEKREKIMEKARCGGTRVKYGVTFKNGAMVFGQISGLPLFYLSLTTAEIDDILLRIQNGEGFNTEPMKALINKLMDSILEQREMLLSDRSLRDDIKRKIDKAKEMATTIKGLVSA